MIEVKIQKAYATESIYIEEKESLMDALIREGYYISAVCGGRGRCGKCKVRVIEGYAPCSEADEAVFSEKEQKDGWRLSCTLYPKQDIRIAFELTDESDFEVIGGLDSDIKNMETDDAGVYEAAVDIGTTTIAMELIDKHNGESIGLAASINSQRKFGADVISRIQASVNGKADILQECIREDLKKGIEALLEPYKIGADRLAKIAIGGNTTMTHLLMGYDCSGLGVYPFRPVDISLIKGPANEIIGSDGNAEVAILPGISTYVGGDIVSGLYACDFHKTDKISLLVDLGTNGEMALGNKDKVLVTSTAAGPAFEGGNILWGTGSVAGAICSVEVKEEQAYVKTIGDKTPVGICGTGAVETVAELLRAELIDETGRLEEPYFDDGFPLAKSADEEWIVFTQKDIREMQLAKSAIRAGIETLLLRYGVSKEQVETVYLAGGFGYKIDTKKAIAIGMFPEEFDGRIQAIGNSSLAGAKKYLKDDRAEDVLKHLVSISKEVELSSDIDFNRFYVEYMMFEE